jgi:TPR repeat protein
LASCWKKGIGVPQSDDKAWELALKGARLGNPNAQASCGMLAAERGEKAESLLWLTLSAAQGWPSGQGQLGALFLPDANSTLVSPSLFKAHYWLKRASVQSDGFAQVRLSSVVLDIAKLFHHDNILTPGFCPIPEAHFWLRRAQASWEARGHIVKDEDRPDYRTRDLCIECNVRQPGTMRCAQCQAFRYCSKKCQLAHWKKGHKLDCNRVKELERSLRITSPSF